MIENIGRKVWHILSRIIIWCFDLILKPFGKKLDEEQEKSLLQFFKFALVGVSNTLVSYLLNIVTLMILERLGILQGIDIYVANCVAFFLSVLWSFFWNNRYVFKESEDKEKRVWWKTLIRTYLAYAFTGLVLSNVISYLCVKVLGINKYIAPIINLVISVPINYVLNKFWAYGQKNTVSEEEVPA